MVHVPLGIQSVRGEATPLFDPSYSVVMDVRFLITFDHSAQVARIYSSVLSSHGVHISVPS